MIKPDIKRDRHVIGGGMLTLVGVLIALWPGMETAAVPTRQTMSYEGAVHAIRYVDPQPSALNFALSGSGPRALPVPSITAPDLVGLIGAREAYLRASTDGTIDRLSVGETLDGWTLGAVHDRSVVLVRGSDSHVATLFDRPRTSQAGLDAARSAAAADRRPSGPSDAAPPAPLTPP